jgi:hypothetical protein
VRNTDFGDQTGYLTHTYLKLVEKESKILPWLQMNPTIPREKPILVINIAN